MTFFLQLENARIGRLIKRIPYMTRTRYYRPDLASLDIPEKANRIINIILVGLVLIVFRVWHLSIVQYDQKLEESRKPQRRTVIEPAKRGTIRDRYNLPLAINKLQYQASILYSQLKPIPSVAWIKDAGGKKTKQFKRREYISKLSQLLAKELNLDPERLEDLIHSKGALYQQIPLVIKEDITEKEYYRLKMLEKDWLGIHVQIRPKRHYPRGRTASDVIGYMGAINKQEFESIIQEKNYLEDFIKEKEAGEEVDYPQGISTLNQARKRLKDLEEQAYTINDYVGKTGIEGRFEHDLRGYHGKKSFYSDARGNFMRELPGSREPLSGQRILLTLSAELQEYAEKLLVQNDYIREGRVSGVDAAKAALLSVKQPWIKGGAVIAMDPNTGEILALASYPRFDPNDFTASGATEAQKAKRANISRWLESEQYVAEMWDQKRPMERENYDADSASLYDEQKMLTWNHFLEIVLPRTSPVFETLERMGKIEHAIALQNGARDLLALSGQTNLYWAFNSLYTGDDHQPSQIKAPNSVKAGIEENYKKHISEVARLRKILDPWLMGIPLCYDKVLLVDLCRVNVNADIFDPLLLKITGKQTLSEYREISAAMSIISDASRSMAKEIYHDTTFKNWRKENEKTFLQSKRAEETLAKKYPKPYLDLLDAKENELFDQFWRENKLTLLLAFLSGRSHREASSLEPYLEHFKGWYKELKKGAHPEMTWRKQYMTLQDGIKSYSLETAAGYIQTMRSFADLQRPLYGKYRYLRKEDNNQYEKHLAAAFYPLRGYGYGRSQAYRQSATQGSIFKLVTAYEALVQRFNKLKGERLNTSLLNPLEIFDQTYRHGKENYVGYSIDGKPIPKLYKGGRLLKSSMSNIGRIDLLRALETSSNPYFSLLAGDVLENPEDLSNAAREFCYGKCTGIDLPAEISGKVPEDLSYNRTGLYAMANGQHTLVVTPLQTAVMLSSIANGGKILKPKIVSMMAGKKPYRHDESNPAAKYPYHGPLQLIGIDFPLFSFSDSQANSSLVYRFPTQIKHEIFMPDIVRGMLLEGMRRVVLKQMREGLINLSKVYKEYPEAISDFVDLKDHIVGKTSTSEIMENLDLDSMQGTNKYTHVWFGGILFNLDSFGENKHVYVENDAHGSPELVVVVYLKYGTFGREAAPLAAQVIQKWREIKKNNK